MFYAPRAAAIRPGSPCSVSDVREKDSVVAAEVWAHIEVESQVLAIVSPWALVSSQRGSAIWRISATAALVAGDDIVEALTWTKHTATEAKTLISAREL